MSRLLKILSLAVVLFLAYMWITILYDSCNKNKSDFGEFEANNVEADREVPQLSEDIQDEPLFAEEESTGELSSESGDEVVDYDALDKKITTNTQPATPVSTPTTSAATNSSGRYLVIAGNYLEESNANNMVNKLKKLGYNNAEKVNFDLSQFHSVCAGRFNASSEAYKLRDELERRGIESYVHTKK